MNSHKPPFLFPFSPFAPPLPFPCSRCRLRLAARSFPPRGRLCPSPRGRSPPPSPRARVVGLGRPSRRPPPAVCALGVRPLSPSLPRRPPAGLRCARVARRRPSPPRRRPAPARALLPPRFSALTPLSPPLPALPLLPSACAPAAPPAPSPLPLSLFSLPPPFLPPPLRSRSLLPPPLSLPPTPPSHSPPPPPPPPLPPPPPPPPPSPSPTPSPYSFTTPSPPPSLPHFVALCSQAVCSASRRAGPAPRAYPVRPVWGAHDGPLPPTRGTPHRAGLCLSTGRHCACAAALSAHPGAALDRAVADLVLKMVTPRGDCAHCGDARGGRAAGRRSPAPAPSAGRTRPVRSRFGPAPLSAGRSGQSTRGPGPGGRMERQTAGAGRGPGSRSPVSPAATRTP